MTSRLDDAKLDALRRQLPHLVAQFHGRCLMAVALLERKAAVCPTSAEAHAHRMLVQACNDFGRWLHTTGMVPDAQASQAQEAQAATPAPPPDDRRDRSGVVAGGETPAGPAAH